jgi:hypothetical protein
MLLLYLARVDSIDSNGGLQQREIHISVDAKCCFTVVREN